MPLRQRQHVQKVLSCQGGSSRTRRACQGRSQARRKRRCASPAPSRSARAAMVAGFAAEDDEEDELTIASNAAVDLVRAGQLHEAEQAARDLLVRFPEVHDGYDRLGMVYEARGDHKQAAYYYQKVIDFIFQHPDQYEPEFETVFRNLIERLDPSNPT